MSAAAAGAARRAVIDQPTMSDATFNAFRSMAYDLAGIFLDSTRKTMLTARLVRRVRVMQFDGFDEYLKAIESQGSPELTHFLDAVTTNLTYFFREPHHFEWLASELFPTLAKSGTQAPVRIWSAGCSAGQEAYSVAIVAQETGLAARRQVRILATDLHSALIPQVAAGRYSEDELRGLSAEQRRRWLSADADGSMLADPSLRAMIIARQLNLFGPWPVRPGVDVIVCRNVLIYFDKPGRQRVLQGFANLQRPGDHLVLGHSETLQGAESLYRRVANTVYMRT